MCLNLRISQHNKYYPFSTYFCWNMHIAKKSMPFSMAKISFHFMKWCNVTLIKSNN